MNEEADAPMDSGDDAAGGDHPLPVDHTGAPWRINDGPPGNQDFGAMYDEIFNQRMEREIFKQRMERAISDMELKIADLQRSLMWMRRQL